MKWCEVFNKIPPRSQSIYIHRDKFDQIGSIVNAPKNGCPRTVTTPAIKMSVALAFMQSPQKSTKTASKELELSCTSFHQLMEHMHLKLHQPKLINDLSEDDRLTLKIL
jgi:hypothetical protein